MQRVRDETSLRKWSSVARIAGLQSLGAECLDLTMKQFKWAILFGAAACVLGLCIVSASQARGGWSLKSRAGGDWHLETGYLLDDARTDHSVDEAGPRPQAFISGKFYRCGPVAVCHRWCSRVVVTIVLALPSPKRLL